MKKNLIFFLLILLTPLQTSGEEWLVITQGVTTASYLVPLFKETAGELGIDLKVAHLKLREFPEHIRASFNPDLYDRLLELDQNSVRSVIPTLRALKLKYPLVGAYEDVVDQVDFLNAELGLAGNNPATSQLRHNKEALYRKLKNAGINSSDFIAVSEVEEGVIEFRKSNIPFPVVVKPANDAAGHGFETAHNETELTAALKSLFQPGSRTIFGERIERVIIQPPLEGAHFGVQGVVRNGKVIVTDVIDYLKKGAVYELDSLAEPRDRLTAERIAIAGRTIEAIELQEQMFHIEGIGREIIDVANRAMGGLDHFMVQECTGSNQLRAFVDSILAPERFMEQYWERQRSGVPYSKYKSGYVVDLIQHRSGIVTANPDIAFLQALPTYFDHRIGLREDSVIRSNTKGLYDSGGAVVLVGNGDAQLETDRLKIREHEASNKLIPVRPFLLCDFARPL